MPVETEFEALHAATREADEAARAFFDLWNGTVTNPRLEAGPRLLRHMVTMYRAIDLLESAGESERFVAGRGISVHGNTKNRYAPLVKAFSGVPDRHAASGISKRAATIALARAEAVAPERFEEWLVRNPIEESNRRFGRQTAGASAR